MEIDKLKRGLFGYKKESVYQYIASVEDDFSSKLLEKDDKIKKNEEIYLSKINKLEEELKEVKRQYEEQKGEKTVVAATLIEARRFAEQLKKETEEKENKALKEFENELSKKRKELKEYQEQIENLRKTIVSMLNETDGKIKNVENEIETVKQACPGKNMTLFERKKEISEK